MNGPRSGDRIAQLRQHCPRCGVRPGEKCRNKAGAAESYVHVARWYAVVRERQSPVNPLQERLDAAERVCLMYAWSPSRQETDTDKATHEVWSEWWTEYGYDAQERLKSGLSDEYIAELARKRDDTRARALASFGFVET